MTKIILIVTNHLYIIKIIIINIIIKINEQRQN